MRRHYPDQRLRFYIGDVRDYDSLIKAVKGSNYIFHAAALKQVPSCEFFPIEATKTNILGTENLLNAAINYEVRKVVCLSTDKAVYPVNAMGMSKAMMEKVMIAKSRENNQKTIICGTRYGNVMASRGSVIPLFIEQIRKGEPITITDPSMTRFMLSIGEAVNLVLFAFENCNPGDIFIQKAPSSSIEILAKALTELLGHSDYPIKIIGTRHGEKRYESLMSREEKIISEDLDNYYRIPADLRDLNYTKYFDLGEKNITNAEDYNSDNSEQLDLLSMKELLSKQSFMGPYLTK
jgi:UDP-glucose 4-epimerase